MKSIRIILMFLTLSSTLTYAHEPLTSNQTEQQSFSAHFAHGVSLSYQWLFVNSMMRLALESCPGAIYKPLMIPANKLPELQGMSPILGFAVVAGVAPFVEEVLFRFVIQNTLVFLADRAALSNEWALAMSSVLFGAFHVFDPPNYRSFHIAAGVAISATAYLLPSGTSRIHSTHGLAGSLGAHMTHNGLIYMLSTLRPYPNARNVALFILSLPALRMGFNFIASPYLSENV
jgi:membrane protease YdiL (CAAX protease family)